MSGWISFHIFANLCASPRSAGCLFGLHLYNATIVPARFYTDCVWQCRPGCWMLVTLAVTFTNTPKIFMLPTLGHSCTVLKLKLAGWVVSVLATSTIDCWGILESLQLSLWCAELLLCLCNSLLFFVVSIVQEIKSNLLNGQKKQQT